MSQLTEIAPVPAIGFRRRYSWKEVCGFMGMSLALVEKIVYRRQWLRKRFSGSYPFAQTDVNQFITRWNAGEYDTKRKRTVEEKVYGILNEVKV